MSELTYERGHRYRVALKSGHEVVGTCVDRKPGEEPVPNNVVMLDTLTEGMDPNYFSRYQIIPKNNIKDRVEILVPGQLNRRNVVEDNSTEYVLKGGKKSRRRRRRNSRKSKVNRRKSRRSRRSKRYLFSVIPKKQSQNLLVDKEYKQFGNIIPGLRDL